MGLGTLELADANGNFIFPDINLAVGSNTFTLQATDSVGNVSTSSLTVVREGTPSVATPAAASINPVAQATCGLSVLGGDVAGAASLTYTWTTTGNPPAAVGFSNNGTNAAKNTTATFHKAGAPSFQVTITNAAGLSTTSNVSVTVGQTTTMVGITPAAPTVVSGAPLQLTAFIGDQFGNPMGSQPTAWTWSVHGGGTITSTGLYTPPYASGTAVVQATAANMTGSAQVTFSGPAEWGSAASGSWSGGWNNTSTAAPGTRGIAGDTVVLAASGGAAVRSMGPARTWQGSRSTAPAATRLSRAAAARCTWTTAPLPPS